MTELNFSEATERFTAIRKDAEKRLNAVRAEISAAGREVVSAVSKAFFDRHQNVHGFRWTQYTPYWMDGEECEFSVNAPDLEITRQTSRHSDGQQDLIRRKAYYLGEIEKAKAFIEAGEAVAGHQRRVRTYSQKDIERAEAEIASIDAIITQAGGLERYEAIVADFKMVARFIMSLKDSDLELIFGDHVEVLVTRSGTEVLEFEHD